MQSRLWMHEQQQQHQPLATQQQQQSLFQVRRCPQQQSQITAPTPVHANAAQAAHEVCVIQRTVRQEAVGAAANFIHFGGLQSGIIVKQQQQQQQAREQNNQLMALVQQQQLLHHPGNAAVLPQDLYTPPPLPHLLARPHSSSSTFVDAAAAAAVQGPSVPRVSSFGRVSTLDVHGLPMFGELLLTNKGTRSDARLEIVCSCHTSHMSVSGFVQHVNAGSHSIHSATGSVVFMDNGQNLLHWRKSLFAKLGVRIDDHAGWDWNDQHGTTDSQPPLPPAAPPLSYTNYHLQALHHHHRHSTLSTREHFAAVNVIKPAEFFNASNSEYFDFINRGGNRGGYYAPAVPPPAEQQQQHLGVGRTDPGPGLTELRPDVSSIELRLGQPSQQAHKAGKSFDATFSQIQAAAALEPSFHQDYGLNVHQFSQQQRLEKVNVLNFNQFGSTGLERTVLCERTKLWAETPSQGETTRVTSDNPFTAGGQLKSQAPEYPLQQQIIKTVSTARHLNNNMNAGLSHTNSAQSSQTTWTLGTPPAARLESVFLHNTTDKQAAAAAYSSGADVFDARRLGEAYRRQHQLFTGSVHAPDRDPICAVGLRNNTGCINLAENIAIDPRPAITEVTCTLERRTSGNQLQESDRPNMPNSAREDGVSMALENDAHSGRNKAYPVGQVLDPVLPASSGAMVSVGENEFPVTRCDFERTSSGPASQPFEWKPPLKSLPLDVPEQEEEAIEDGEKSAATDGKQTTCTKKAQLRSEASTKSSENALSGFSDARRINEEASTLESESQKQDVVDEASGIDKCSSDEQGFADKASPGDPRESSDDKGEPSVEASGSSMIEASTEAEAEGEVTGSRRRKKTLMRWKSVNMPSGGLQESDTGDRKQTPRQPRTARALKDRCKTSQRFETAADKNWQPQRRERGPGSNMGSGKMMSLKSIMENSAGRTSCDDPALPKQARKRKLSELSTQALKDGPFSTPIPRGERSPRGASKRSGMSRVQGGAAEEEKMIKLPSIPKRKRDFHVVGDGEPRAAKRKSGRDDHEQPPSTTNSCIDEAATGTEKVKWKSLQNDSFDTCPKNQRTPGRAKADKSCSVCGSSSTEAHNQLIHCTSCPIKVHQACYGVPKVPKASWKCRPCKSNSDNIVCVLCGYGGGAMTGAQSAGAAVKDLLRVWNAAGSGGRAKASRGLRRSSRKVTASDEADQEAVVCNSVTASAADSSAAQWIHMVCALWMPGTRCLNLETMGAFDVSAVSAARRRLTCSICKRQGGSCIQCHETKCAVPFHAWCAHTKGLLHIESVNDTGGHVRFHGKCPAHHAVLDESRRSKCAPTQEYKKKPAAAAAPQTR